MSDTSRRSSSSCSPTYPTPQGKSKPSGSNEPGKPQFSDDELMRYSRHFLLPEFGHQGQETLKNSHVAIIGLGGLGSPAALYLAASGIGHLTLVDDDKVELSNLQRQILFDSEQLQQDKALAAQQRLTQINPEVTLTSCNLRALDDHLHLLIQDADLVLDCTDNFTSRQSINRACKALQKPLLSAAALGFSGQLALFDARQPHSPCYHCLFPNTEHSEALTCSSSGVLSPVLGVVGSLQATLALQVLAMNENRPRLLLFDGRRLQLKELSITQSPECEVCNENGSQKKEMANKTHSSNGKSSAASIQGSVHPSGDAVVEVAGKLRA